MAASKPLEGIELVDCASANAKSGIEVTARQCGYGKDVEAFWQSLDKACQQMGISIDDLNDLVRDRPTSLERGIEIAPDTDYSL
ncbi:hypothetical protein [Oscillatoria sp. FACHB-1406]|uniref:hypothetical protein n=1 Tax=Oscillatoria sp. FACHB-1406 TaxID=2692846 RepID=UPI00168252E2|nr:hypothetical protein [Oscillatoria sp. FACHB-1406]MBD2579669.1 hypothetical protein [Oscillatoria sp. FACHB-1406]